MEKGEAQKETEVSGGQISLAQYWGEKKGLILFS